MEYNVGIAYLLWLISGFGALGFHRFYMGKTGTGVLWFFTGGLAMIGAIYDAITLPRQIREANIRKRVTAAMEREDLARAGLAQLTVLPTEDPEKTILKIARRNGGQVSPGEVALESQLSLEQAKKLLEKFAASGTAELRVRSSGVLVYVFPEFLREGREDYSL